MTHAIRFHKTGGPDVLQWEEVTVGDPGPGEARIRLKAVGLNSIDTYHRSGPDPPPLPAALARERPGQGEAGGRGRALCVRATGSSAKQRRTGAEVHRRTGPA